MASIERVFSAADSIAAAPVWRRAEALEVHCPGAARGAQEALPRRRHRRVRSPLVNVRTWLAVSVYMVIVQAFVALTDGVGPHTGERRFKCGHNFSHTL